MKGPTLKLTARQAQLVWDILDGAGDAGACEDGLTLMERQSLDQVMGKLRPFMLERAHQRIASHAPIGIAS